MRRIVPAVGIAAFGVALTLSAQYQASLNIVWLEPGGGQVLPDFSAFDDTQGTLGVLNAAGNLKTDGHPFFTALGTNGRACVSCHQPAWGMSLSVTALTDRWRETTGKDPVFAAFDGSNCPNLPQEKESSHSLLLKRGLFRIPLAWPPRNADGSAKPVDFKIEVVRDPTGCNTSKEYGLNSANPTISVYRRPRMSANLNYVVSGARPIALKTGLLWNGSAGLRTPGMWQFGRWRNWPPTHSFTTRPKKRNWALAWNLRRPSANCSAGGSEPTAGTGPGNWSSDGSGKSPQPPWPAKARKSGTLPRPPVRFQRPRSSTPKIGHVSWSAPAGVLYP